MAKTSDRRCKANTRKGSQCRNKSLLGYDYCHIHNYSGSNYSGGKGPLNQWKAPKRSPTKSKQQKSDCFIATAVYGENSYQVNIF